MLITEVSLISKRRLPLQTPEHSQDLLVLTAGSKIWYCLTLMVIHLLTGGFVYHTDKPNNCWHLLRHSCSSSILHVPCSQNHTAPSQTHFPVLTVVCLWLLSIINGSFFSQSIYLKMSVLSSPFLTHLFSKQQIPYPAYLTSVLDCGSSPWTCFLPLLPLMLSQWHKTSAQPHQCQQ